MSRLAFRQSSIAAISGLALSIAATTIPASRAAADDRYWLGVQTPQPITHHAAPFQGPGFWSDFSVPGANDRAIFGSGQATPPSSPGNIGNTPNYVHFGNFNWDSFTSGVQTYFPAVQAQIANAHMTSGDWTFDFGPGIGGWAPSMPPAGNGSLRIGEVAGQQGGTGFLHIGSPGQDASLRVLGGRLTVDSDLDVGMGFRANGTLRLEGPLTQVDARSLRVGNAGGSGRLEVLNGAQLRADVGLGPYGGPNNEHNSMSVLIDGEGTMVRGLGGVDHGSARISGGATVSSFGGHDSTPRFTFVGGMSTASVAVTGEGSIWKDIDRLTVGGNYFTNTLGRGTLEVTNGGQVIAGWATIANRTQGTTPDNGPESVIRISGENSRLTLAGPIDVGEQGRGRLVVTEQGRMTSGNASVGSDATASGIVDVSNRGEWTLAGPLVVGNRGKGELVVNGGTVRATNATIGANSTGIGEVRMTASTAPATMTIQEGLIIGSVGSVSFGSGHLRVGEGCTVTVGGAMIVGNNGTLSGKGKVVGNVAVSGGTVSPGESPGTLTIDGLFLQDRGSLLMELGGPGLGEFDQLIITGDAHIQNAALTIALVNGYLPVPGTSFELFSIRGMFTLDFASVQLDAGSTQLPIGYGLDLSRVATTGTVTVVPTPGTLGLATFGAGLFLRRRRQ